MKRYILSPEAKTDIADIRKYTTRQWGKAQMDRSTVQLRGRMRWRADNARLGQAREAVQDGGEHVLVGGIRVGAVGAHEGDPVSAEDGDAAVIGF